MGRYEEAIIIIDEILTHHTEALSNKALALVRLGWIDEALKIYDEAIKNEPEKAILWIKKVLPLKRLADATKRQSAITKLQK